MTRLTTMLALTATLAATTLAQTPLTLTEAIRAAREKSDETQIIAEKSAKLDAMKRELWAGALPQITGYANAGRGSSPFDQAAAGFAGGEVVNPVMNRYAYGVEAQQPIYSFGRLGQSFRTASKQIAAQNEANRSDFQKLELQALDAFYGVVTAEARVRVIETSLERQRRSAGFLESNFKGGAGARSTLLLARSALKGLEPERIRAERDADAARMALNRLVGRDVRAPLVLDTADIPELLPPGIDTSSAALDRVLDRRPDVGSSRVDLQACKLEYSIVSPK